MPRAKKIKSVAKQNALKHNAAIVAWRQAAKQLGYLVAGSFRPIPFRGTPEHEEIKKLQKTIVDELKSNKQQPPPAQAVAVVEPVSEAVVMASSIQETPTTVHQEQQQSLTPPTQDPESAAEASVVVVESQV
jgi:hypothetical protein